MKRAYVVSEVEVLDDMLVEDYRRLAASSIERHGGRYLVRGGLPDAIDGDWPRERRLVIAEFSDMARVRTWYRSTEYAPALALSKVAMRRRLLFVGGVV